MKKSILTLILLLALSVPSLVFADLAPEPDIFRGNQNGDTWLLKGLILLSIVILIFLVKKFFKKRK